MPIDPIIARTVFARRNGTSVLWLSGNRNRTRTRQHSCNIRRLYGNVSVVSRQTAHHPPHPSKWIHLPNRRICTAVVFPSTMFHLVLRAPPFTRRKRDKTIWIHPRGRQWATALCPSLRQRNNRALFLYIRLSGYSRERRFVPNGGGS